MTASITDARTRSVEISSRTRDADTGGAAAWRRSGIPSSSATVLQERPETAWARILVSRPAPKRSASSRGYRCAVTASASTLSPRKARRA